MKLEINGTSYKLNFGLGAFELTGDKLKMSPDEVLMSLDKDKTLYTLTYCAILNELLISDESIELPFNYQYFVNWIGEQPSDIADGIVKAFWGTVRHGKTYAELYGIDIPEEAEVKKKPTKKRVQPK